MSLQGKCVLITGGAKRIGRALALAVARKGANVVIHYNRSSREACEVQKEIEAMGKRAIIIQSDLMQPDQVTRLMDQTRSIGIIYALINNAAIFEPLSLMETTLEDWQRHLMINLTAPFLLSKQFAAMVSQNQEGRIINILDWRALRPGKEYLPYTISKAALAALTKSLALELAPIITVNGLALGAILPPSHKDTPDEGMLNNIPAKRWGKISEVEDALLFLLDGPSYITGEIIHVDGGRHLV